MPPAADGLAEDAREVASGGKELRDLRARFRPGHQQREGREQVVAGELRLWPTPDGEYLLVLFGPP
jgi:hypothetical protein